MSLFPEGVPQPGNHDELVKVAKQVFLKSLDLYILDLERNNLVEKNSPITGATISFTPEKLAKLSMKDDDGTPLLTADDVLEVLGVDTKSLEARGEPIITRSTDGEYKFYRYTTNEPVLRFIKEVNQSDPENGTRYYFQLTEEELKRISEEKEAEKHARDNTTPIVPNKNDRNYANMRDMVNTLDDNPTAIPPEEFETIKKQVDGQN